MTKQTELMPVEAIKSTMAKLASEHQKLRISLKENMAALNAEIDQKSAELNKLILSVNIDDATAFLMGTLRDDLQYSDARKQVEDKILSGRKLTNFGPVETQSGFNGSGDLTFSRHIGKPIHLLDFDAKIWDLVALAPDLFFPAIEANVRAVLKNAGCPETGPAAAELLEQARGLSAEVQGLEAQRRELRDQFNMTAINDQPTAYREFLQRTNGSIPSPRIEPTVKRADKNGNLEPYEIGHSMAESIALMADKSAVEKELDAIGDQEEKRLKAAGRA